MGTGVHLEQDLALQFRFKNCLFFFEILFLPLKVGCNPATTFFSYDVSHVEQLVNCLSPQGITAKSSCDKQFTNLTHTVLFIVL